MVKYAFNSFWPKSFKKYLRVHLEPRFGKETKTLIKKISGRTRKIQLEFSDFPTDQMTPSFMTTCAVIAASYEVLINKMESKEEVVEFLQHSFKHTAEKQVKLTYKLMFIGKKDMLKTMEDFFKNGMPLYGDSFEFNYVKNEAEGSFGCHITKCFFNDFFTKYGVPELTTVLCHWDENWLEEIDKEKHGLTYSRPTTLGYGGDKCRFDFKAECTDDKNRCKKIN